MASANGLCDEISQFSLPAISVQVSNSHISVLKTVTQKLGLWIPYVGKREIKVLQLSHFPSHMLRDICLSCQMWKLMISHETKHVKCKIHEWGKSRSETNTCLSISKWPYFLSMESNFTVDILFWANKMETLKWLVFCKFWNTGTHSLWDCLWKVLGNFSLWSPKQLRSKLL